MPTDRDLLAELYAAVETLTKTRSEVILQGDAETARVTRVTSKALIAQLREAIVSTVGAHASGGTLASQRNVLDSDAYDAYRKISKAIIRLYGETTSAAPFPQPEQNLRTWYIAVSNQYRSGKLSSANLGAHVRLLESWVTRIDHKLNPPVVIEIISPCPECGKEWAETGEGRTRALRVVYSLGLDGSISSRYAHCECCGTKWDNLHRLGELLDDSAKVTVA